jgi:hypothetical protein
MAKWFSNYGQVIQIVIQFAALCVGIRVGLPQLWAQGLDGLKTYWPVLVFPLVAGTLWLLFERWYIPMLQKTTDRKWAQRFPDWPNPNPKPHSNDRAGRPD